MNDLKLTGKQEKFCQEYMRTACSSESYRNSYDCSRMQTNTLNTRASELLRHPKIIARLHQLRQIQAKRLEVTIDSLTAEFEEIKVAAMKKGQYSAAVQAVTGKARLHGFLDQRQIKQFGDMTMDEAKDILRSVGIDPDRVNH